MIGVSSLPEMSPLLTQRQVILTGAILVILLFQILILVTLAFFPYVPDPGSPKYSTQETA